ncbi:MAG: TlpA disulfide reductase family protein [Myxococcota bacterium]|jgi:peroxiredoxin|nr:TlpA disulfide reductase family protein [Myxococcota bacterium]
MNPRPSRAAFITSKTPILALTTVLALAFVSIPAPSGAQDRAAAPAFTLPKLKGGKAKLSDYKDKVVVLSFWATWCAPCLQELPLLDALAKKYEDQGLVVLAIDVDASDTAGSVRSTVKRLGLEMPVLLDVDSAVLASYNPQGSCPFTVFIDREGRLHSTHDGFSAGDEAAHEKTILQLLAEDAP